MGALRDPAPVDDIVQEWLFSDPWLILVRPGHPLAAGFDSDADKLTPAQLDSLSWVLPRRGAPGREIFERFMAAKGVAPPSSVVECSSFVTIRALLLESDHAAILSRQQVESDVSQGMLKIMGPPLTGSDRPIGLTTRKGFVPTRLQQAFLDDVRQYVADLKAI
jgi:DNA-binding transcriptional LysR family regulator